MSTIKKHEFWAVLISAIALIVSSLTWLDVRRQLRLAAGQIRSYVQVVDVTLEQSIDDASLVKVRLRLKNFGQTAATNVYGEMDYGVGIPDPTGRGNEATRRQFGAMGPGRERTVILVSNRINSRSWPTPRPRGDTVYFWGTVWFTDDTTHENRKEDWCYSLPLKQESDLRRTDLEDCEILTYQSKDDRK